MPRSLGRIHATIWNDGDFLALDVAAQRLYMFLLSQPDLSHAGLIPMRIRRWAKKAADSSSGHIEDNLDVLTRAGFIVLDEDTEEVLIRTFVRNDGVYKQPRVMDRMREDAKQIESPALRAAFAIELDRLPLDELSDTPGGKDGDQPSTREQVERVVTALHADFEEGSRDPSEGVSDTPRVRAHAPHLPPSSIHQPPTTAPNTGRALTVAPADATPERGDVERICKHLADRIEGNGALRPEIGKTWLNAARLLIDRDGRSEDDIHKAIDWCQDHEFWRANVLSMPKLREQYDQLRLQAQRRGGATSKQQETDDLFARAATRLGIEGGR